MSNTEGPRSVERNAPASGSDDAVSGDHRATRRHHGMRRDVSAVKTPMLLLLSVLLWSCLVSCSSGQSDRQAAEPNDVGPDIGDKRVEVETELDSVVAELRAAGTETWGVPVPGLAAAVMAEDLGDRPVSVVSGSADPPGDLPLEVSDRFHVGSATKTFTAALIMKLDEEGKLSLDDPISRWIDYENGSNITVEMLLAHTSGIPDFVGVSGRSPEDTPEDSISFVAQSSADFEPGEGWNYSNTNYIMLGLIAEQVAGKPWEDLIVDQFVEPLGLTDTYVWTGEPRGPSVDGSRMACSKPGEPECDPPERDIDLLAVTDGFDWKVAWSAGAIVSTPSDLARWVRELVSGDVLDAEHRELLTTPTPQSVESLMGAQTANSGSGASGGSMEWTGYSLGLCRFEVPDEGVGWGHTGVIDGFVSNVAHMVDSGYTVSLTSNFEYFDMRDGLGNIVIDVL